MITQNERIAWAAGLWEGEGHIRARQTNRSRDGSSTRWYIQIAIEMCDLEPLEQFHQFVRVGSISGPYKRERIDGRIHNETYRWTCHKWDETNFLIKRFHPFLSRRRYLQAQEALALSVPQPRLCKECRGLLDIFDPNCGTCQSRSRRREKFHPHLVHA